MVTYRRNIEGLNGVFAPTPNPSPRAREGLQERLPVSLPDLIDSGGEMRFC